MRILIYLLLSIIYISCSNQKTVISGKLQAMEEWSEKIYLLAITDYNDVFSSHSRYNIDTAEIDKNGNFEFILDRLPCTECLYRIEIRPKDSIGSIIINGSSNENYVLFELSENSKYTIEGNAEELTKSYHISSDSSTWSYRELRDMREPIYDLRAQFTNEEYLKGKDIDSLRQSALQIVDRNNEQILNKVVSSSNIYDKLIGLKLLYDSDMNMKDRLYHFEMVLDQLPTEYAEHPFYDQLKADIYKLKYVLPVGSDAPSLVLPDKEGRMIDFRDIGENLLLVDFWASWCSPCRKENKEVVRPLYDMYKNHGFRVYSVSLDDDKNKWLEAMKVDGMIWTNVSDLLGRKSPIYDSYKIEALPTTYLIDARDFKILAKDVRGDKLKQFVSEYYK